MRRQLLTFTLISLCGVHSCWAGGWGDWASVTGDNISDTTIGGVFCTVWACFVFWIITFVLACVGTGKTLVGSTFSPENIHNPTYFHVDIPRAGKIPIVHLSWWVALLAGQINFFLKLYCIFSYFYHLFCKQYEWIFWKLFSPSTGTTHYPITRAIHMALFMRRSAKVHTIKNHFFSFFFAKNKSYPTWFHLSWKFQTDNSEIQTLLKHSWK